MTDRELLELAAKAAGMDGAEYQGPDEWFEIRCGMTQAMWHDDTGYWNPLEADGDAFRLAVRTGEPFIVRARCVTTMGGLIENFDPAVQGDDLRATRRVIVRAAAAIGAQQEQQP